MSIIWKATSFGPGSLVRFKSRKSHPWTYAIYRDAVKDGARPTMYAFSDTPLGPITLQLRVWPEFIQAATTTEETPA